MDSSGSQKFEIRLTWLSWFLDNYAQGHHALAKVNWMFTLLVACVVVNIDDFAIESFAPYAHKIRAITSQGKPLAYFV